MRSLTGAFSHDAVHNIFCTRFAFVVAAASHACKQTRLETSTALEDNGPGSELYFPRVRSTSSWVRTNFTSLALRRFRKFNSRKLLSNQLDDEAKSGQSKKKYFDFGHSRKCFGAWIFQIQKLRD